MGHFIRYALPLMLLAGLWGGCATLESETAPAIGPLSPLEQYCSTKGLIPLPPMIGFGDQFVAVTDVCLAGDTLRGIGMDGSTLEKPAAGIPRAYRIGEGCVVGDGRNSGVRVLFYKPFTIPNCK
jgi:hypothetical protein